jgi:P-type Ca2+ transporter type 2C
MTTAAATTVQPIRRGLSEDAAKLRFAADGPNSLPQPPRHGMLRIAWDVLSEPMFILLVSAGALYLVMGELGDAGLLLGFVVVVMGITIVQERRTERALDALRDLANPLATVIRDGKQQRIAAVGLVRGDAVVLSEGDRVPADVVLRDGVGVSVDESLLTGESVAVGKVLSPTAERMDRPGGDGHASLFSGTLVTAGQGVAEVLATGLRTELGKIGTALNQVVPERTKLQRETGRMVRILAVVGLALCCLVVVVYAFTRGGDAASWKQGILAGITMAMAILPEELPVILTVFLALGAWRISRSRVLTRRMPAIETLGAATVLCTDKTGTLTENRMTVTRVVRDGHDIPLQGAVNDSLTAIQAVLDVAVLASKPDPFDPMERAIHSADEVCSPGGKAVRSGWTIEREYPLSACMLAVSYAWRQKPDTPLVLAAKGAPEAIAGLCGLQGAQREAMDRQVVALAGEGLRVLAVARGEMPADRLPVEHSGLRLQLIGLIALADPIRANVPAAIAECRTAGIRVLMITGDYPVTAQTIARQAGIVNHAEVVSGPEMDGMDDVELARRLRTVDVFARVVPAQKLRIVQALKANSEVVAMTGDGVNDAPALKAAHIGIAMGKRGADVARESSALVLLDDDFTAIVAAVRLGRRIFDNIRKAIAFTFAVHVPIAGLSILPVFIPGWPLLLLPVHIVFLELVIDPSCTLVFEAEEAEADLMKRPPRDPGEHLFSWHSIGWSVLQGVGSLAACIGIYLYARTGLGDDVARTLTFTALVASFIAIIITNRSWTLSLVAILRTPNTALWWVVLGAVGVMALILALPMARGLFHFAHPPALAQVLSVVVGVLSVVWFEIIKHLRRRHA